MKILFLKLGLELYLLVFLYSIVLNREEMKKFCWKNMSGRQAPAHNGGRERSGVALTCARPQISIELLLLCKNYLLENITGFFKLG